jgi:predicted AAA+ superfamily ATPase
MIIIGDHGIGKTAFCHNIIFNEFNINNNILYLNTLDNVNIKTINDSILFFCKKKNHNNKLIIIDEVNDIS